MCLSGVFQSESAISRSHGSHPLTGLGKSTNEVFQTEELDRVSGGVLSQIATSFEDISAELKHGTIGSHSYLQGSLTNQQTDSLTSVCKSGHSKTVVKHWMKWLLRKRADAY